MSILNKKSLAAALLVGLGMAGTAGAYTVTSAGFPILVATADVTDATTNIGINIPLTITLAGDTILGRTTGFTIRYQLDNGATFGEVLDASDLAIGTAARFGMPGAWNASIAAGGGLNDAFVVIALNPGAPADCDNNAGTADAVCGLIDGTLLTIAPATSVLAPGATGQVLDSLTQLQQVGQQITAVVSFTDPVTGNPIGGMGPTARVILRSGDPVSLDCSAVAGDTEARIDVGASNGQASKTFFSSTGAIGANDSDRINLGSITAAVNPGFATFDYQATDAFTTVISGDFSAFSGAGARDVFLSSNADCSTIDDNGTINNAAGTVTFTYTNGQLGGDADGHVAFVCATVPAGNTTPIDDTPVSVISTTFTRGGIVSNGDPVFGDCDLLPLRYNGSVVDVYHINPAFNSTAQSFVRIINPNDAAGLVTITAIDDAGNAAPGGAITFTLAPQASMQLNSQDLEQGNAAKGLTGSWGDGTGKWRAVVTGEFADMVVQSLTRNSTDGTVTNLTDADTRGEQVLNSIFNNN